MNKRGDKRTVPLSPLVTIGVVTTVCILADNISGIGVVDDPFLALTEGLIADGAILIFER